MTDATPVDDIIVVGVRAKKNNTEVPEMQEEVPEETGQGSGGGAGFATQAEVDAENQRQKDCAAKKAGEAIKASPLSFAREWFSHVFNRNGSTAYHAPRGGTGDSIPQSAFTNARTEFGFSVSDMTALVHNHPGSIYCNDLDLAWNARQAAFNQYPSTGDWAYADQVVAEQGGDINGLTLYIVGCDGSTRGFQYSDKASLLPLANTNYQQTSPTIPATLPPVAPADCPA